MANRQSLLDKILSNKIDITETISKSNAILNEISHDINGKYISTPYSIMAVSFNGAVNSILERPDYYNNQLEVFLDYCDLVLTVIVGKVFDSYTRPKATQVYNILEKGLATLGYGFIRDKERNIVTCFLKDQKAEVVASNCSKTISDKIYEYLSIRKGDAISEKRNLLKALIDDIDTFCKNNSNNSNIGKLKHFYQCVRHPKDDPVIEFTFYYDDEEKWLDHIFQMILDVLSIQDLGRRVEAIVDAEKTSKR